MTCILSLPFERGALIASDLRVVTTRDGVRSGAHAVSKLVRDPCELRWLVGSNPVDLSDELVNHLIAGGRAEDLPAKVDRWIQAAGLGRDRASARLSNDERRMLGSTMHVIERGEDGAFYARGIAPVTGKTTTFGAQDHGFWFSLPMGAEEDDCRPHLVTFADDWRQARARYGGTVGELTGTLRATGRFFTTLEARYGGPDGWMDDQLEIGGLWRLATGTVVTLHLRPTRAARVLGATDAELLAELETDDGLPAGPLLGDPPTEMPSSVTFRGEAQ